MSHSEILGECGVTAEQYDKALGCVGKKVSILYKRKPCEGNKILLSQMHMQC